MTNTALNFETMRRINLERCTAPNGFDHPLNKWSVAEWGNATAGECGEACNKAKKILRIRGNTRDNIEGKSEFQYQQELALEIAGIVLYCDLWAASEDIDLGAAVCREFNKKSREVGYSGTAMEATDELRRLRWLVQPMLENDPS